MAVDIVPAKGTGSDGITFYNNNNNNNKEFV